MNLRNYKTITDRRKALEKEAGVKLSHVGNYSLDSEIVSTRNCENMIGITQVPLGIAGPLKMSHQPSAISHQPEGYYIPLATTEGALVASVNRGCKAITESGGAVVDSYRVGATRGPVFVVENISESDKLNVFLEERFSDLKKIAEKTSRHLILKKYIDRGVGRYRYVRFVFDTKDAMGMNMVTIATNALVAYIQKETGIFCLSVAGNYDVDKKPSWLNVIEGRGVKVWAEVTISEQTLKETLKTTAQKVYNVWLAKCMVGSAMSGSMGFNAQFANVIAALFLATGQDLGHVGEGSMGVTTMEVVSHQPSAISHQTKIAGKDLYVSVYLPDVMVGTVGGGTGLATQKEALELLGVAGGNEGKNAQKLAEIVGATVLAGEISLLSSLEEGTLVRAHERLGRGNIEL